MLAALPLRKLFRLVLIGFVLFFILTTPNDAGRILHTIVNNLWGYFLDGAKSFSQFIRATFG